MIAITKKELLAYLSRASKIKDSSILPVHGFTKFEVVGSSVRITKANTHSFVCFDAAEEAVTIKGSDTVFSVSTNILTSFIKRASSETITFSFEKVKGKDLKMVIITDGVTPVKSEQCDVADFLALPEKETDFTCAFGADMLKAIGLAAGQVGNEQMRPELQRVHLYKTPGNSTYIVGTDGNMGYFYNVEGEFPPLSLEAVTCRIISDMEMVSYGTVENWDLFDGGKTLYGFVKTEVKPLPFEKIIDGINPVKCEFTLDRKQFMDFNELAVDINPISLYTEISILAEKKGVKMVFNQPNYNIYQERFYPTEMTGEMDNFTFSSKLMIGLLKDLPYENITFRLSGSNGTLYLSDASDEKYLGAIRPLVG